MINRNAQPPNLRRSKTYSLKVHPHLQPPGHHALAATRLPKLVSQTFTLAHRHARLHAHLDSRTSIPDDNFKAINVSFPWRPRTLTRTSLYSAPTWASSSHFFRIGFNVSTRWHFRSRGPRRYPFKTWSIATLDPHTSRVRDELATNHSTWGTLPIHHYPSVLSHDYPTTFPGTPTICIWTMDAPHIILIFQLCYARAFSSFYHAPTQNGAPDLRIYREIRRCEMMCSPRTLGVPLD